MVQITDLHFSYRKKSVFTGLDLSFQSGYIYGLLGKNGTGKSTLLHNICGLLFPDSGKIDVLGFMPEERRPAFLQKLFIIPEEFYLPDVPIRKFIRCNGPFYPKYNHQQFEGYLKEFDIPSNTTIQRMSYGQKKKLLISFALACNTDLLLMDEPTNGLDIMSKSQFRKVLAGAINENKCIVVSTHQVKDLEALIDYITVIDEGKILFNQSINEILDKLTFKLSFDAADLEEAIYSEPSLTGNATILRNKENETGQIDLELLYKAVITNGRGVRDIFNAEMA